MQELNGKIITLEEELYEAKTIQLRNAWLSESSWRIINNFTWKNIRSHEYSWGTWEEYGNLYC